jgi:hypothetical protein
MGWTLIQHISAPTSNIIDFTGLSLSGYQRAVLLIDGLTVGTDGVSVLLRLSTAATLRTTGYRWRTDSDSSGGTGVTGNSASDTSIRLADATSSNFGVGNGANKSYAGKLEISNLGATLHKLVTIDGASIGPTGNMVRQVGAGILEQTGAIDGIRILLSTGTMTAGKASLYGLTTS